MTQCAKSLEQCAALNFRLYRLVPRDSPQKGERGPLYYFDRNDSGHRKEWAHIHTLSHAHTGASIANFFAFD